ncbi:hypothetical protein B0H34DRAFT_676545 [Crassisporium funariophilum]|nr:hypothetical protein B0H34DRAFT_676540 [Crassisporium funariophilum]KAF8154840.1 hypothetical protein B0H34DRAFT_676545 [Crassisporium funariophilum]
MLVVMTVSSRVLLIVFCNQSRKSKQPQLWNPFATPLPTVHSQLFAVSAPQYCHPKFGLGGKSVFPHHSTRAETTYGFPAIAVAPMQPYDQALPFLLTAKPFTAHACNLVALLNVPRQCIDVRRSLSQCGVTTKPPFQPSNPFFNVTCNVVLSAALSCHPERPETMYRRPPTAVAPQRH